GAVHPYQLVTGILLRLLKTYSSFRLYMRMPCLSIHNIVHTSRGDICAKHIVHATDGWMSRQRRKDRSRARPYDGTVRRNMLQ
ncbi:hypothetical protein EDD85DRAFT_756811, partial [Armillaria nabsnona]